MSEDLIDRIRLASSPRIGPITFRQLLQRFGSVGATLAALADVQLVQLELNLTGKPERHASGKVSLAA